MKIFSKKSEPIIVGGNQEVVKTIHLSCPLKITSTTNESSAINQIKKNESPPLFLKALYYLSKSKKYGEDAKKLIDFFEEKSWKKLFKLRPKNEIELFKEIRKVSYQLANLKPQIAELTLRDFMNLSERCRELEVDSEYRYFLSGASLQDSKFFTGLELIKADLSNAILTGADFSKTYLQGSNLTGVQAAKADFASSNLSNCDMQDANLRGANFSAIPFTVVNATQTVSTQNPSFGQTFRSFTDAISNLSSGSLRSNLVAIFTEAISAFRAGLRQGSESYLLSTLPSPGANLTNANLNYADLFQANLNGASLQNARLIKAKLNRASLNGTIMSNASMQFANLKQAFMFQPIVNGLNLKEANLGDADIRYPISPEGLNITDIILNRSTRILTAEQIAINNASQQDLKRWSRVSVESAINSGNLISIERSILDCMDRKLINESEYPDLYSTIDKLNKLRQTRAASDPLADLKEVLNRPDREILNTQEFLMIEVRKALNSGWLDLTGDPLYQISSLDQTAYDVDKLNSLLQIKSDGK